MDKEYDPTVNIDSQPSRPSENIPPANPAPEVQRPNMPYDSIPAASPQVTSSGPVTDSLNLATDKSEKMHNFIRVSFACGFFILVIASIIGIMYYAKLGIFGEKRVSAGNHSYAINENSWEIGEIDESDYSISLNSIKDKVYLIISDNPMLSTVPYDDQSAGQALGTLGQTSGIEKSFGDIGCIVYTSTVSRQGATVEMKTAFCNVADDYNALVSVASQNSTILDKYIEDGVNILKTGQK